MNITIIGTGIFGKAIGKILNNGDNKLTFWTNEEPEKVILPENINITNSYKKALENAEIVFFLTASKYIEDVFAGCSSYMRKNCFYVIGSKGFAKENVLISSLFYKKFPNYNFGILSGPTFATDVANKEPIGFTLATKYKKGYSLIKKVMPNIYIENSNNIIASELGGIFKNIYAIGSGIIDGLNYGTSTNCLYITKVLQEMEVLNRIFKNKNTSQLLLSNIGDLVLTCTSRNSRNYTFGNMYAIDKSAGINYAKSFTVEGYENLQLCANILKKKGASLPILDILYKILLDSKEANLLIKTILN